MGKLVTHAVELAPSALVLAGRLSGLELRTVALGIETEPGMAVLVVAPLRPRIEVLLALASGISGYLPPESDPEVVADAVSALCAGELVVPREALTLVADPHWVGRGVTVDRTDGQPVELTHREWEVLVLVRQAYSTPTSLDASSSRGSPCAATSPRSSTSWACTIGACWPSRLPTGGVEEDQRPVP